MPAPYGAGILYIFLFFSNLYIFCDLLGKLPGDFPETLINFSLSSQILYFQEEKC